jgi:hypothetical protein
MASYAFLRFKINNDFFECEQLFNQSQSIARQHGILEIFHGWTDDNPHSCFVLMHVPFSILFGHAGTS